MERPNASGHLRAANRDKSDHAFQHHSCAFGDWFSIVFGEADPPHSIPTPRFNLEVDRDRLTNAGDCLGRWRKHQIEVTPSDWLRRYRPARPARFRGRRE